MKVAFVDLKRQNKKYKREIAKALNSVVEKASYLGDPINERFEQSFAKYCGKKYCLGLNSGTDALFLGLMAYGIGRGDEVITAANSYIASAMTASNLGAKVVLADVNPLSYNIEPKEIEKRITKKTKAIIPVHLYGQSADMDPIIKLAKKHKLIILEDACQGHGAKYKNKSLPYTESAAYSFYPGKNLGAFGDGGAIVTNSSRLAKEIEYLRNDGSVKKYVHKKMGFKSRLDTIQAAVLLAKMKHIKTFITKRRKAAKKYNKLLAGIEQIVLPQEMDYAYHSYHIYAILAEKRNKLQKFLSEKGIATVIHYPTPIHLQEAYNGNGYKKGDFPVSEMLSEKTISLPLFPEIEDREIEYVSNAVKKFYKL